MVGAAFAVTHGFGPSTPPRKPEIPRSITLPDAPAAALDGSASVSVSSTPVVHHYSPGTIPAARPTQRHALLVGINHAAGGRPLQGAVTDALNVKQALLQYGFPSSNVVTLLDGQATRAAILKGLDDLVAQTPDSGLAVVAIAGHSRQYGGVDQLLAADGARVNSTEIASRLQRLRARAWIALPDVLRGWVRPAWDRRTQPDRNLRVLEQQRVIRGRVGRQLPDHRDGQASDARPPGPR